MTSKKDNKDNLELYNIVREVPKEAQKPFTNGHFTGTDINPMWRIKELTNQFGICGIGWYYEITDKCMENIMASDEIVANVEIKLYVKIDGEWSKPITGIGGSKLANKTSKGLYVNDEAYKMATTDAISVACKQLGFGANIYWENDNDKYIDHKKENIEEKPSNHKSKEKSEEYKKLRQEIQDYANSHGMSMAEIGKDYKLSASSTEDDLKACLSDLKGENNAE